MSSLGFTSLGGFNMIDRFPMMAGDGNTNVNVLAATPTPFDKLANDPNIGPGLFEYVTGTGVNDIITITKTGPLTANVTVQPFNNAAYMTTVDAPGPTGTSFSYAIDLTRPLIIDGGARNDRIILDGDLGNSITVRGMHGTDELIIMGKNAATASYTPGTNTTNGLDGNANRKGTIVIGLTTINFQEFETTSQVSVQDVGTFTLVSPGGADTLIVDSPTAGQIRHHGTVNGTVAAVPLLLTSGIATFALDTGDGSDKVTVDFTTGSPLPTGGISYNGGESLLDSDKLVVTGYNAPSSPAPTPGRSRARCRSARACSHPYQNLEPLLLGGTAADLIIDLSQTGVQNPDAVLSDDGPPTLDPDATQDAGFSAIDGSTFEFTQFANPTSSLSVLLSNNGDTITLKTLDAAFAAPTTITGGTAVDTVNVQATAAPLLIQGTAGADIVNVGSLAPVTTGGNLAGILGQVTIRNASNFSAVTIDDSGDATPRNATLDTTVLAAGTFARLQGLGNPAAILWRTDIRDVSSVNIKGGSGGNTFAVNLTDPASSSFTTTLNTGSGADAVTIQTLAANYNLQVNGQGGIDTLTGPNLINTWNITGANAGTLLGGQAGFATVENLTGGSARDVFGFSAAAGATLSGKIDGGAGSNWLDYSAVLTGVTVNLATGLSASSATWPAA